MGDCVKAGRVGGRLGRFCPTGQWYAER